MKTTRCLVYIMNQGVIDIQHEVSPIGEYLHWKWCDVNYFDGFPVINDASEEESIKLTYDNTPYDTDDMVYIVIEEGIKDPSLHDMTWVTLTEY